MRRVVCTELGSFDNVVVQEAPEPEPRPDQVVVSVRAAGVAFVDALLVLGKYQIKIPAPFTPGTEIAGDIVALGREVSGWSIGERVVADVGIGGFAERVALPAGALRSVPEPFTYGQAATFQQAYETMLFAYTRRTVASPGEHVLVLGAGGGVGLAAVDLARVLGLRPIAAASTADKLALAQEQGAVATIAYEDEDLKVRARELAGGHLDLVVDNVGGAHAEPALRALGDGGRYLVVGFASGTIPALPLNQVLLNNRTVIGVDWGGWKTRHPAEHAQLQSDLFELASSAPLHPVEPTPFAFSDAARVLTDMRDRRVVGKVVLVP